MLAGVSLLALGLDAPGPASLAPLAYVPVALYAAWAVLVAVFAWRTRSDSEVVPLVCHGVDIAYFALLVLLAGEWVSSPYVLSLVFVLAAATVRWRQAGIVWTGLLLLAALLAAGSTAADFEAKEFIIQVTQLAFVAVLFGCLGAFQYRLRSRLSALSSRSALMPTDMEEALRASLEHVIRTLDATGAVLAWERPGQSWLSIAAWTHGSLGLRRMPREGAERLAPLELEDTSFLASATPTHDGRFRTVQAGGSSLRRRDPVPGWIRNRFHPVHTLSAPVRGSVVAGRLFALDPRDSTSDDIALGDGLARQLGTCLDELVMFELAHLSGLAEERLQLARELHDGVINSLAAGATCLASVRDRVDALPAEVSRAVGEVQELLESEQRELWDIVASLQPGAEGRWKGRPLEERLEGLRLRLRRHWRMEVEVDQRVPGADIADPVGQEIFRILREALVDAAQHGHASHAKVVLEAADGELRLAVHDDGSGPSFQDRSRSAAPAHSLASPYQLVQRIAALGGRLETDSKMAGERLAIRFPHQRPAAGANPGA